MKLTNHEGLRACGWIGLCLVGLALRGMAGGQAVSTTTVQGTVYQANGQAASGTLNLSWPAFTTANSQAIAAGRATVTIAPDGFVSVNLAPNQGATPAGLYYTAIYHLSDGTTSTEYWVIPVAAQVSLGQVRAQLMPAVQAVQAVSKAYVDQEISQLTQSLLTASGGTLSGPLYLNGDPTVPLQAADKHYVDSSFALAIPLTGGAATGPLTALELGAAYQVDQFSGADFGAKLQACLAALSASYGGTCDARNFTGSLSMGSNLTISTANATVLLPCATVATASQLIVTAGTRNVTLHGCSLRGASAASGSQGGTVFAYSGAAAMIQVGDPSYASETPGFHLDNVAINTTAASASTAQGLAAYRTQELDIESTYFLGNSNQTGITLDGTGNYTGGTFYDNAFTGFQTAVNAIGHQAANPATTDWMNASTFVRLHIDCPTSGGSPIAGTYGINLQQGDGNTITGGDVEGCDTALHLGPNAVNNTIVGLRNENSNNQIVADAGSSYNSWITGGTMFTGKLTDNGTRNSFLDSFHRSFNGMNGDWYGSQKDATVTNHFRIGTGAGNERGLLDRYQTDYGYRWTMGLSDATAGEQFYQVQDELNNVFRLSIGQYNNGASSTNNQTVINAAGTGAVVLNGSNNSGTGGVVFGSGGPSETTVATIGSNGNAQFAGNLQVGGISTFTGSTMVKNQADAEIDQFLWAGASASQKESFVYKDWDGSSQWYMVKDAGNNWALNSAPGGLDSFKAYQSTNSGDTYINASNSSGIVRINYEAGSGTGLNIYGGNSSTLYASFTGAAAIKFPGLAASGGHSCLQIDNSGYITNTGTSCATGGSTNGTVNAGTTGQIAFYPGNGAVVSGIGTVPVSAGGTGSATASGGLSNLGGISLSQTTAQTMAGALNLPMLEGTISADQKQSPAGTGNNGIAMSLAQCASQTYACLIQAPALYAMTEAEPFGGSPLNFSNFTAGPNSTQPVAGFLDLRYGAPQWIFNGAQAISSRFQASPTFSMNSIAGPGQGLFAHISPALRLQNAAFAGGRNSNETYGDKTNFSTLEMRSYKYTEAQGGGDLIQSVNCLGNGDCVGHEIDTVTYGGPTTMRDEGNESMRFEAIEGGQVFGATLASITAGSDGSLALTTSSQTNNGFQGEGRLLIDLSQAYNGAAHGSYIAALTNNGSNEIVACGGACGWDSTYGTSTQTALTATVSNGVSPTNTFPQSSAVLQVASSAGFTVGNLACVWDNDYECEKVTAVGTGTVTIAVDRLPHPSGAYVTTGGLTGYAIEFEADRVSPSNTNGAATNPDSTLASTVRLAIPVMYNSSGNVLTLFQGGNSVPGAGGGYTGRAYTQMAGSGGSCSVTVSSGAVTAVSVSGGTGYINPQSPPQLVLSGITYTAAPQVYVSGITGGALTAGSIYSSGAGIAGTPTCSVITSNPYDLYPAAKVTGVYNATAGMVDGTLTTEPFAGTVAVSDAMEEPHYFWQRVRGANNVVGAYIPSLQNANNLGFYTSLMGIPQGNDAGLLVNNASDPTLYRGYIAGAMPWTIGRGQAYAPYGVELSGSFGSGLALTSPPLSSPSGSSGALVVNCGTGGCANWASAYNVIGVQGNGASNDGLAYNPSTRAWALSGSSLTLNATGGGNVPVFSGSPTAGHLALWSGSTPQTLVDGGGLAGTGAAVTTGPASTTANDAACFADGSGTLKDCGTPVGGGTVTSFSAPAGSWPGWLVPSVSNATSTPSLAVTASAIPNSALANAAATVNGQSCGLGGSCTVLATPSGAAGGDLGGSYPGPTVKGINGAAIPASATVLGSNSSSQLVAVTATGTGKAVLASGPTFTGNTTTFANGAAAEQDVAIQPGSSADQIGALAWNNYAGTSEWKLRKDASNYLRLTDVVNSLDREVLYQNGQTAINSGAGANAVVVNGSSGSGTGGLLVEGGGSSPAAVLTVTGSGNTTAAGFVAGKFLVGSGTMTLTAGSAAGTGPTIACASSHVCDGVSGTVALSTGTGTATGTLATLSFPNTHSNYANCMVTGTLSGTGQVTTLTWSESTTAVTVTANAALTASTAYQIRYWCGGN